MSTKIKPLEFLYLFIRFLEATKANTNIVIGKECSQKISSSAT